MNRKLFLAFFATILFFTGCAKEQLLIEVYSPPKEQKKVEQLVTKDEHSKEGSFLTLGINPEVRLTNNTKNAKVIESYLVGDVKEMLTQTNFISIHPIYMDARVGLSMEVIEFVYNEEGKRINANLGVKFSITKDSAETFSKNYNVADTRYSKSGRQALPSKSTILAKLSKQVVKKFVKDISPLKTKKLVELKSLPDEIAYTINYAKAKNYEGAIDAMEKYTGEKTMEYYFNLAVYYEGLAAQEEKLSHLSKASQNYDRAMAMGGSEDELVIKEKGKFDKFYKIFKMVENQRNKNEDAQNKLNQEYEILD